jgi:hypothetical protein
MVKLYVNSACVLYGWRKLILTSLAKLTHCLLRYEAGTVVKGSDGWQDLCSPMGFEIPLLLVECVSELRSTMAVSDVCYSMMVCHVTTSVEVSRVWRSIGERGMGGRFSLLEVALDIRRELPWPDT